MRVTVEKPKSKGKSSAPSSEPAKKKEEVRSPKEPRGASNAATADKRVPGESAKNAPEVESLGIDELLAQLSQHLPLMTVEQESCKAALSLMQSAWSMQAELSERAATFVWQSCEADPDIMEAVQALATTGTVPTVNLGGHHRSSFPGAQALACRALKPHKAVHRTIICDGCEKSPIVGLRYKSLSRNNFDVCAECHAKKDALWAMDTFVVLPYPRALEDLARAHPEISGQASEQQEFHPQANPHPHPHPNPHPRPRPHQPPQHHRRHNAGPPHPPQHHQPHHHNSPPPRAGPPHHRPHGYPHGPNPPPPHHFPIPPFHLPPHHYPPMPPGCPCPPPFGFPGCPPPPGPPGGFHHPHHPPPPPPLHHSFLDIDMLLDAAFVSDVTVPDNTTVAAGEAFTKTWRLRNTGVVPWGAFSSNNPPHQMQGLLLQHMDGDALGAAATTPLDLTAAKDEEVDLKVALKAPEAPGVYTGYFRLAYGSIAMSTCFGPAIWTCVEVAHAAKEDAPASHAAGEEKEWLPVSGAAAAEGDDDFHEVNDAEDEFHDAVTSSSGVKGLLTGVAGIKLLPADEASKEAAPPLSDAPEAEEAAGAAANKKDPEVLDAVDQGDAGEPEDWVEVMEVVKIEKDKQH